jgi:hypothetical protein
MRDVKSITIRFTLGTTMAESDADEWEKVRDMVRNAPPGTAQPPWTPDAVVPRPPSRRWLKVLVIAVLLVVAAAGAYLGWLEIMRPAATERPSAAPAQQSAAPKPAQTPPAAPQPTADVVTVKRGVINVRSSASSTSAIVGKLSAGDRIEKIGESGTWLRVRFESRGKPAEGWVRRDVLE